MSLCACTATHPVTVDSGAVLEPGSRAQVDLAGPLARHLLDSGQLTEVDSPPPPAPDAQKPTAPQPNRKET